jgi:hypothetical protein
MKQISVKRAAIGVTIRIELRLFLVEAGRVKSPALLPVKRPSARDQPFILSPRAHSALSTPSDMLTCAVSNFGTFAIAGPFAVAEHSKVPALKGAQRDLLDDRSRYGAQQQERKGGEEDDGQRSGRS